jgi:hypothetical protein
MAASYTFPASLPQYPLMAGYTESIGANIIRTPMELGPAKQRRRGSKPTTMSINYIFTDAQLTTFNTFVLDTIKGIARFNYTHPRTAASIEVRIVPSSDGSLFSCAKEGDDVWSVSFQIEVLP